MNGVLPACIWLFSTVHVFNACSWAQKPQPHLAGHSRSSHEVFIMVFIQSSRSSAAVSSFTVLSHHFFHTPSLSNQPVGVENCSPRGTGLVAQVKYVRRGAGNEAPLEGPVGQRGGDHRAAQDTWCCQLPGEPSPISTLNQEMSLKRCPRDRISRRVTSQSTLPRKTVTGTY